MSELSEPRVKPCCHQSQPSQKATSFWSDGLVWRRSAYNTMWCLIGCSIGDFGTIMFMQAMNSSLSTLAIMALATINGLLTSICLETILLKRSGFNWIQALKTAMGMSFISMLAMEISMNLVDWFLAGGAKMIWWVIPIMLLAGFLAPWPYNYWRLKKFNKGCCH